MVISFLWIINLIFLLILINLICIILQLFFVKSFHVLYKLTISFIKKEKENPK